MTELNRGAGSSSVDVYHIKHVTDSLSLLALLCTSVNNIPIFSKFDVAPKAGDDLAKRVANFCDKCARAIGGEVAAFAGPIFLGVPVSMLGCIARAMAALLKVRCLVTDNEPYMIAPDPLPCRRVVSDLRFKQKLLPFPHCYREALDLGILPRRLL